MPLDFPPVSLRYAAQMTNRQPVKLLNILVALVVAYAIFCGLVFAFQERLLYFPLTLAPDELAMLVRDGNLRPWRPESLQAYLRQPEDRLPATARGPVCTRNRRRVPWQCRHRAAP